MAGLLQGPLRMRNRRTVLGLVAGVFFLVAPRPAVAQETAAAVYQAQSEYIRSFADFIAWPAAPVQETINFCILGRDPYGELLDKSVLSHPVGQRRTVITRAQRLDDMVGCNVLFVSSSNAKHESKILNRLRNQDVLTVGDADDFAARGGIIQFVMNEGHVHFLINVDAAERAGLKIDASLLALAKIVHDDPADRDKK